MSWQAAAPTLKGAAAHPPPLPSYSPPSHAYKRQPQPHIQSQIFRKSFGSILGPKPAYFNFLLPCPCYLALLFTMSSSPSFPYPLPVMQRSYERSPSVYRQTNYFHGKDVQTIECRRRSAVTLVTQDSSVQSGTETSSTSRIFRTIEISPPASRRCSSRASECDSDVSSRRHSPVRKNVRHVTPRLSQRSKAQVVITQDHFADSHEQAPSHQSLDVGLVTPPPTPKMDRLATPELCDFDERPFCDCCAEVQVMKFCAGCGCRNYTKD